MSEPSSPGIILAAAGCFAAAAAATVFWLRSRRKTPQEKERLRRLAVNAKGRLADGELLDGPDSPPSGNLLYYKYRAFGVEYNAAQDISPLHGVIRLEHCRPGDAATIKYDPRAPSNSIIACEEWHGLRSLS